MLLKIRGLRPVQVESLREASAKFREHIERLNLGASEVGEAKVCTCLFEDGKNEQVARISYNGRVWGMDGKEIV